MTLSRTSEMGTAADSTSELLEDAVFDEEPPGVLFPEPIGRPRFFAGASSVDTPAGSSALPSLPCNVEPTERAALFRFVAGCSADPLDEAVVTEITDEADEVDKAGEAPTPEVPALA